MSVVCVFVPAKFMLLQLLGMNVRSWVQFVVSIQNAMYRLHFE